MTVKGLIDEIEALREKATPGKWERDTDRHYSSERREHYYESFLCADTRPAIATANHCDAQQVDDDGSGVFEDRQAYRDLDFIARLVNAWPTIKELLESLAADKERLTGQVNLYSLVCNTYGADELHARLTAAESRATLAEADAKALREALKELLRTWDADSPPDFIEAVKSARSLSHSPGETNG